MIFAANSALANKSSACGRFRSANTFPELDVNSRVGIFSLLYSLPVCSQVEAVDGSDPIHVVGWRFRMLPSFGRHEERRRLSQVVPHTQCDTCRSDRLRVPARPCP